MMSPGQREESLGLQMIDHYFLLPPVSQIFFASLELAGAGLALLSGICSGRYTGEMLESAKKLMM